MKKTDSVPILLLGFNRPDTIKAVFDRIKEYKPQKLYVSIDGARNNVQDENVLVDEVRKIVKNVNWDCDVKYRFLDENLGCGLGVSSAISWMFETEEYGIILEDDCLPSLSFFKFAEDLLEKYKDNENVFMISGNNYNEEFKFDESYTFSKIAHHIWGWATWKRAWDKFSIGKEYYKGVIKKGLFDSIYETPEQKKFYSKIYSNFYNKQKITHTWDFQWNFIISSNLGYTIVPKYNLVTNIGLEGIHTSGTHNYHNRKVSNDFKIENHPKEVKGNINYDLYHFKNHWKAMYKRKPFLIRIYNKILKIWKGE